MTLMDVETISDQTDIMTKNYYSRLLVIYLAGLL